MITFCKSISYQRGRADSTLLVMLESSFGDASTTVSCCLHPIFLVNTCFDEHIPLYPIVCPLHCCITAEMPPCPMPLNVVSTSCEWIHPTLHCWPLKISTTDLSRDLCCQKWVKHESKSLKKCIENHVPLRIWSSHSGTDHKWFEATMFPEWTIYDNPKHMYIYIYMVIQSSS